MKRYELIYFITLVAFIITQPVVFASAQKTGSDVAVTDLPKIRLEPVHLRSESIAKLLSQVSFHYDLPIGFEIANQGEVARKYEVKFKGGDISDLMNQVITDINGQEALYQWRNEGNVINIYPKIQYRDPFLGQLLGTNINTFYVPKRSSCDDFSEALIKTPEAENVLKTNGISFIPPAPNGFYFGQLGKDLTFNLYDSTIASILNTVISRSDLAKFWVIGRNNYSPQTFFIAFAARPEDFAKNQ